MCHAAVNWVLNEVSKRDDLKPAEKWLLVVMADHADRPGWSFVHGHGTLAKDSGMSKRSVLTMLAKFEDLILLRRSMRFRHDGTRTTDLISLLGSENPALGAIRTARDDAHHVQIALPEGVKFAQQKEGNKPGKVNEAADAASSARGTRLPEDWEPGPNIATLIGLTAEEAADQFERFKDYWCAQPGAKGRKADWTATWRNWCRTALERRNGRGSPATRAAGGIDFAAERAAARMQAVVDGVGLASTSRRRRWALPGS